MSLINSFLAFEILLINVFPGRGRVGRKISGIVRKFNISTLLDTITKPVHRLSKAGRRPHPRSSSAETVEG